MLSYSVLLRSTDGLVSDEHVPLCRRSYFQTLTMFITFLTQTDNHLSMQLSVIEIFGECLSSALHTKSIILTLFIATSPPWDCSWGPPFETQGVAQNEKQGEPVKNTDCMLASADKNYDTVLRVAGRAVTFLKALKDDLKEGMTTAACSEVQDKLITAYCLTTPDEGESFMINKDFLKHLILLEKSNGDDGEELPSKKALTKRLKKIVTAFIHKTSNDTQETEDTTLDNPTTDVKAKTDNHGFFLIDQTERCNTLLAEMTRGLLKLSKKANRQKEFAQLILDEIDSRLDDITNSGDSRDSIVGMENLRQHILLYIGNYKSSSRPAKNILR